MIGCGATTGILFSRKACGQPAAVNCGRCKTPLCKLHLRPQASGPFLCPNCDAYEQDDDWRYSSRDNSWRYRDSSRPEERAAAAATGAAAGAAAAGDLSDEDKPGLSTNASGAWHGPDAGDAEAGAASDDASDADRDADSDFDAS